MRHDPISMEEIYALARRRKHGSLSAVLRTLRMTGAVFFDTEAFAPWVSVTPDSVEFGRILFPEAEHVIPFHVIAEGSCWAEVPGAGEPVLLRAGNVMIAPRGDYHLLGSAPGLRDHAPPGLAEFYEAARLDHPLTAILNRDDDRPPSCRFLCGFIGCDVQPFNPLLDALPKLLVAEIAPANRVLLATLLNLAEGETDTDTVDGDGPLARVAEFLFVEILREYMADLPPESRGWLAGLRDRHVGAALRLIHNRSAEPWTIEKLAREVGLSRSGFAERFTAFTGVAPMTYVARWRMQIAVGLLQDEAVTVGQAAIAVGYESEAAFHRTFKRYVGVSPGNWRRRRRSPPLAAPA